MCTGIGSDRDDKRSYSMISLPDPFSLMPPLGLSLVLLSATDPHGRVSSELVQNTT